MAHSPSYISLCPEDFNLACPNPDCLIHLTGSDARNLLEQLQAEYARLPDRKVKGLVAFIGSRNLTMADLRIITGSFPACENYKAGIGFYIPEKGEVELFLFVQF